MLRFVTLRSVRASWMRVYLGFAVLLIALMPPGNVSSDGDSMLAVATSLATEGSFAVPCSAGIHGEGGECFSTFYPLQSVLAAPLLACGRVLADIAGTSREYVGEFVAQVVPTLAAAGVATFTVLFARELGADRDRALGAGLTVAFATEVTVYYRSFFADVLAGLLACIVVWGFLCQSRWTLAGIVLLILAKPQLVPVGVLLGAVFAVHRRSLRPLVASSAATAAGALIYGVYNVLRFGDALNFGGEARSIHAEALSPRSLAEALGLLTISPGRGLLIHSPIVILGIYALLKRRGVFAHAALAVFAGSLVLHLANPGSGYNWGSRYLIAAVPLLAAGAWSVRDRYARAAPIFAVLGALLVAPNFAGFYQRAFAEHDDAGGQASDLYWSVTANPAVAVWGSTRRQIDDARRRDVRDVVNMRDVDPGPRQTVGDQRFYSVVAQWWWMTPVAGIPRALGALGAVTMLLLGGLLLWRWRGERGRDREPSARAETGRGYAPGVRSVPDGGRRRASPNG